MNASCCAGVEGEFQIPCFCHHHCHHHHCHHHHANIAKRNTIDTKANTAIKCDPFDAKIRAFDAKSQDIFLAKSSLFAAKLGLHQVEKGVSTGGSTNKWQLFWSLKLPRDVWGSMKVPVHSFIHRCTNTNSWGLFFYTLSTHSRFVKSLYFQIIYLIKAAYLFIWGPPWIDPYKSGHPGILEPQSLPFLFPCFTWFNPDLPVSPFSLLICQIFSWNRNHNVSNFSLYVLFASLRGHCSLDFLWLPPEATILTAAGITSFQICWSSTGKTNEQFKPWCYKKQIFSAF